MFGKDKNHTHLVVLERGEEIVESLISYCDTHGIRSGWVTGIGALSEASLALYDSNSKQFQRKTIKAALELLVLNGNISMLNDTIVSHLHAVMSDDQMNSIGGHLDRAIVAATCEMKIEQLPFNTSRRFSDEIGLNLIERN